MRCRLPGTAKVRNITATIFFRIREYPVLISKVNPNIAAI